MPTQSGLPSAFKIQDHRLWEHKGGGLAYTGIPKSVAVKFDLYNNAGEGSDSTGLYTGGANPLMPSTDLSSTGINLHNGDPINVTVSYDGSTLTTTETDLTKRNGDSKIPG